MKDAMILLIEDERQIRRFVRSALENEGLRVSEAETRREGLLAAGRCQPELVILDLGLPDGDGAKFVDDFRAWSAAPVLVLSARSTEYDKIGVLDAGADDYLTKPFALPELEARVRALTRRGTGQARCIEYARLAYDQADRVVKIDGQVVELSAREVGLLEVLLLRAGRLVSKEQLVDHLCGWGEEVSNNAIEVYVHRLRKKLEQSGVQIVTVRGLGYCLEKPDVVA